MKRAFSVVLVMCLLSLVFASASVGAEDAKIQLNGGEPITLTVNLTTDLNPTLNTVPTAEEPNVILSTQAIADAFMEMYPNVTIEWDRSTFTGGFDGIYEYMNTQMASGTAPMIHGGANGAATFADRNWFLELSDYIATPNTYVPGNAAWKDLFPEYMWQAIQVADGAGNILGIPIRTYTGSPTGYYYNKEIFAEVGVEVPKDWEEMFTVGEKLRAAGYTAIAPSIHCRKLNPRTWDNQFSLGTPFAMKLADKIDYDSDGILSATEVVRATKEGYFSTVKHDYAREIYSQMKRKYADLLDKGYENTDYEPLWNEGKVAMLEDGTWRLPQEESNTKRAFEYGLFPPPVIMTTTTDNVVNVQYTEKGPYQPQPAQSVVVIKQACEAAGGQGAVDTAIEFLKFLTAPDNMSQYILEIKGKSLGSVYGCAIPAELTSWFNNPFPILPNFQWNIGDYITADYMIKLTELMEMWEKDMVEDDEFFTKFEEYVQTGTDLYIEAMSIDTTGWVID